MACEIERLKLPRPGQDEFLTEEDRPLCKSRVRIAKACRSWLFCVSSGMVAALQPAPGNCSFGSQMLVKAIYCPGWQGQELERTRPVRRNGPLPAPTKPAPPSRASWLAEGQVRARAAPKMFCSLLRFLGRTQGTGTSRAKVREERLFAKAKEQGRVLYPLETALQNAEGVWTKLQEDKELERQRNRLAHTVNSTQR